MHLEGLLDDGVIPEFLPQGSAIDAEYAGSLALITLREVHDGLEKRSFYLPDDEIVQIAGAVAVQSGEILVECIFGVFTKWLLAGV